MNGLQRLIVDHIDPMAKIVKEYVGKQISALSQLFLKAIGELYGKIQDEFVSKNQGESHAGEVLTVGDDGNVIPKELQKGLLDKVVYPQNGSINLGIAGEIEITNLDLIDPEKNEIIHTDSEEIDLGINKVSNEYYILFLNYNNTKIEVLLANDYLDVDMTLRDKYYRPIALFYYYNPVTPVFIWTSSLTEGVYYADGDDLYNKLDPNAMSKYQGGYNAGKFLTVGTDGYVTTTELDLPFLSNACFPISGKIKVSIVDEHDQAIEVTNLEAILIDEGENINISLIGYECIPSDTFVLYYETDNKKLLIDMLERHKGYKSKSQYKPIAIFQEGKFIWTVNAMKGIYFENDVDIYADVDEDGFASKEIYGDNFVSLGRMAGTEVGENSFALGQNVEASGIGSHAEGNSTKAVGTQSHAEGYNTEASGTQSHAEGNGTKAVGVFSHAEGYGTKTDGPYSHAEGYNTTANSPATHAEGNYTEALGMCSHAEGDHTKAAKRSQHVEGQYNIPDSESGSNGLGKYVHIVGNGTDENNRSNAHTLDWDGNAEYAGDVTANGCGGKEPISLVETEKRVSDIEDKISSATGSEIPIIKIPVENDYNNRITLWQLDDGFYCIDTAGSIDSGTYVWGLVYIHSDAIIYDGLNNKEYDEYGHLTRTVHFINCDLLLLMNNPIDYMITTPANLNSALNIQNIKNSAEVRNWLV